MMDVVTFGETMALFNPDSIGPIRYVQNFNKSIAGAESNVAIALARLGHKVGWFSRLGNDEFGRYIQAVIRGEGVDISRVIEDEEKGTGILFKERFIHSDPNVYYYRKDSAASYLKPVDIDESYIKNAKILHITGITPALSQDCRHTVFRAIEIAKENNVLVSFDPNIRLKLWNLEEAAPVLMEIAKKADIIFPGIDEGKCLLNVEDPKEIAQKFLNLGCSIVAVKLGKDGCYVASKDKAHYIPGYLVERPVDTVGAGDGFAAGFLSGYINKCDMGECAILANAIGAMATMVKGDMEGYPIHSQLMQFIGRNKTIDR
jgi:2-dehydro-3-deoxygluconokinase